MKYSKYSTVIVGSGIAGLYAAMKISRGSRSSAEILVITKTELNENNSRLAQGGIVGVLQANILDNVDLHVKDTLKAGAGLSSAEVCRFISQKSEPVIEDLIRHGVDFDKDDGAKIKFTIEGAHSVSRILHCQGDTTGQHIEQTLIRNIKNAPNITVMEHTMAVELLIDKDLQARGLIVYNPVTDSYEVIYSSSIILATGGLGQVYKYTTNPKVATGDGLALAYRAGAVVQDMEFIQFHPTALAVDNENNRSLISEALRGEGAKLCDKNGYKFMHEYHKDGELASRDIVTRAIFDRMKKDNSRNVYLDATHLPKDVLKRRFPNISNICASKGIDIAVEPIPVSPAAHYTMGGVKTDTSGRTSIKYLYAVGEVGCTSLHGANRLASNSLLECVVIASQAAHDILNSVSDVSEVIDAKILESIQKYKADIETFEVDIESLKRKLKDTMWTYVGIERDETSLLTAKSIVEALQNEFNRSTKCAGLDEYELKNLITIAKLIISFALKRKESRGAHYRTDFPATLPDGVHNFLKREQENDEVFT